MNYQNYTVEDYLLDKQFREWVENPNEDLDAFWKGFLASHPEKKEVVDCAREMMQKMKFRKYSLRSDEVSELWTGISKAKDNTVATAKGQVIPLYPVPQAVRERRTSAGSGKRALPIAASVALLCILSALFFWINIQPSETLYTTAYGETSTVTLPDGSVATLNAHSSLRVPASWEDHKAREVWLEGEAFFEVKKISQNDNLKGAMPYKFVVHTDGVAVEVLGTEFNVNTRREKVQVVLNSGKVRLKWQENEMLMQPGDLIEVNKKDKQVAQRIVKPEAYSSWKENHLLCDATTLRELAHTIEDRFGYEVVFLDKQLSEIEVSGTIPLDSRETFELVISRLINVHFELKGNKLLISK